MPWMVGGSVVGYDNRASGSPAGQETLNGTDLPPLEPTEATHVGTGGSVSSISRSSDTCTLTTGASHGLSVGDVIRVAGANQSAYNGDKKVLTAPSGTTLTFAAYGSPTTPATGTITWTPRRKGGK